MSKIKNIFQKGLGVLALACIGLAAFSGDREDTCSQTELYVPYKPARQKRTRQD
ncbi:MAG: hypothetical protein LBC69_00880 [Eubacteriaceae bacterium]|nr:hypothetical protein [Eubacteriaceae bacterium]